MKALLIVAHGSRRGASNDSLRQLTAQIANLDHLFSLVECAFLELAEPSIPKGIDLLVKQGVTDIVILPYFLAPGRHVVNDVPAEVQQAQNAHPTVKMQLTDHLGSAESMPLWLINIANGA